MGHMTTDHSDSAITQRWMFWVLFVAGLYNILWGALSIFLPSLSFHVVGARVPHYLELWQCIGMIVGVYGIGYLIAARNPYKHWPIILVGLLGKVLGPFGFVKALSEGTFPLAFGWNIVFNDLIWWIPFGFILYRVKQFYKISGHKQL